jgi:pyruvate dehydrogenase E1 component alpha subunit
MTENELEEIRKKVEKEVDEAIQFAEEAPEPDPSELYQDLYV